MWTQVARRPAYSAEGERALMRRIRESSGRAIEEAVKGDRARGALLAALTANESGGSAQAYRFEPANYRRLMALLDGTESKLEGLTRGELEKRLKGAKSAVEREAALKKLAGLHGFTQLPGYCCLMWEVPIEDLQDKATHFQLAARRMEELCDAFDLDAARDVVEIGRRWNGAHANGRSGMYGWRLGERVRVWGEMGRV